MPLADVKTNFMKMTAAAMLVCGWSLEGSAEMPTLTSVTTSVPATAEPVDTSGIWHDNLADGWKAAKERGLPMVIFISSDRCIYCDAMEQNTWCDGDVRRQLAGGFVPIRLKRERNAGVLSRIKIRMYPTTLVASPGGKVIDFRTGYQPPERVGQLLRPIRDAVLRRRSP